MWTKKREPLNSTLIDPTEEISSIRSYTQRDHSKVIAEGEPEISDTHIIIDSDSEEEIIIDLDKITSHNQLRNQLQGNESTPQLNKVKAMNTNNGNKPTSINEVTGPTPHRSLNIADNSLPNESCYDLKGKDKKPSEHKYTMVNESLQPLLPPIATHSNQCAAENPENFAESPKEEVDETLQDFINKHKPTIEKTQVNNEETEVGEFKDKEIKDKEINKVNEITEEETKVESTTTQNTMNGELSLLIINNHVKKKDIKKENQKKEQKKNFE